MRQRQLNSSRIECERDLTVTVRSASGDLTVALKDGAIRQSGGSPLLAVVDFIRPFRVQFGRRCSLGEKESPPTGF